MSNKRRRDLLTTERKRQAAQSRRTRGIWTVIVVSLVVLAVVTVFIVVQNSRTSSDVTAAELPTLVNTQGGGMVFGDGPVDLDVWLDFQCPNCQNFEATYGDLINQGVENGNLTLTVHPLSFLDENLQNDSSSLAANAFGCSGSAGPETALEYQKTIFEHQPGEQIGVPAWSNEDLIAWGTEVGVTSDDWSTCVNDGRYVDWVEQVAASQVDAGVTGTPTVFVDGELFDLNQDLTPTLTDGGN